MTALADRLARIDAAILCHRHAFLAAAWAEHEGERTYRDEVDRATRPARQGRAGPRTDDGVRTGTSERMTERMGSDVSEIRMDTRSDQALPAMHVCPADRSEHLNSAECECGPTSSGVDEFGDEVWTHHGR